MGHDVSGFLSIPSALRRVGRPAQAGHAGTPRLANPPFPSPGSAGSIPVPETRDEVSFSGLKSPGSFAALQRVEIRVKISVSEITSDTNHEKQIARQAARLYELSGIGTGGETDSRAAADEILNPLEKLKEHFSPRHTVGRIVDFALSRYGYGRFAQEDTAEQRRAFADTVLPAVQSGFDSAVAAFGELPKDVMDELHATLETIHDLFDKFLQGTGGETDGRETDA